MNIGSISREQWPSDIYNCDTGMSARVTINGDSYFRVEL